MDLIFEHDLLRLEIDKKLCVLLLIELAVDYPVCEGKLLPIAENFVISLLVFHKYGVHLAVLKIFDGIIELYLLELYVTDLLHLFVFDYVWSFLKVDIFEKLQVGLLHIVFLNYLGLFFGCWG